LSLDLSFYYFSCRKAAIGRKTAVGSKTAIGRAKEPDRKFTRSDNTMLARIL